MKPSDCYTAEELREQGINEAMARKLGYAIMDGGSNSAVICTDFDKGVPVRCIPDYCHSISAAWEIVEYCQKRDDNFYLDWEDKPIWTCQLGIVEAIADTAPMAICEAFLKLDDNCGCFSWHCEHKKNP